MKVIALYGGWCGGDVISGAAFKFGTIRDQDIECRRDPATATVL